MEPTNKTAGGGRDAMPAECSADEAAALTALLDEAMPGTPAVLQRRLLMEVAEAFGLSGRPENAADDKAKVEAALQAIHASAPRDALEAMLAAETAAAHAAAMRATRLAARHAGDPRAEAHYAREARRQMQLVHKQAEALDQRRARAARQKTRARMAAAAERRAAVAERQAAAAEARVQAAAWQAASVADRKEKAAAAGMREAATKPLSEATALPPEARPIRNARSRKAKRAGPPPSAQPRVHRNGERFAPGATAPPPRKGRFRSPTATLRPP